MTQACRRAGLEPVLGQAAPQMGSVVNLVTAELSFSLVPASMRQLQAGNVAYRDVKGTPPVAPLALACRRGETRTIARNFIALAVKN